jgi:uncharacterized membrane protein
MEKIFTTKRLCRAGAIAALYAALTYVFAPFAFAPFQIRPAEALCILPLFFFEAVPALWIGCMIANLSSPYLFWDVGVGALTTLVAALATYLVGRLFKKDGLKLSIGGIFPVILNAFIIPLIIVFVFGDMGGANNKMIAYSTFAGWIFLSQSAWVYGLGTPLYLGLRKHFKK